jgi:RNA polymerase sigma-70 factor (ECF subfamily)
VEGDLLSENCSPFSGLSKEVLLQGSGEARGPWSEETALVEGLRSGNLLAFERLYQTQGARMKSIAFHLLGNAADAEDAVQEAFLRIYRGAASFRGRSSFATWTYRVLVNACHDLGRRRRARPEDAPLEDAPPRAASDDHPLRLALERAIARLRARHRAVFLLFEVEGFTHREIAEILNVAEGTSRTLLFEAKRDLQRLLRPLAGAAGPAAS